MYTLILEQSEQVCAEQIDRLPQLAGHLVSVGDLRADCILETAGRRRQARHELGFNENRLVAVFLSTWGPDSLVERHGQQLFDALVTLASSGMHVVLAPHPKLWSNNQGDAALRSWDMELCSLRNSGVTVLEPADHFAKYLGVSDVAVSDHTSTAVGFAVDRQADRILASAN